MYHKKGKMQVNSSAGQILDEVETSSSSTKADENILRILGQKALLAPILTDTDKNELEADTITEYRMGQHNLYGNMRKRLEYDMLSMIFICLGKDSENLMIRDFNDLIDYEVIYENKRKSLEDVGVRMSRDIEVGVQSMCNITERYIEKGMKKGLEEGMEKGFVEGSIVSAINIYRTDLGLNEQEIKGRIMDKFGLDSTEADRYMAMKE